MCCHLIFSFQHGYLKYCGIDVPGKNCGQMDAVYRSDSEENIQNYYHFYFQ